MKKLLTLCFVLLGVAAQAQKTIKIHDFIVKRGFSQDTATGVVIRCVSLDVDIITASQRPTFYLALVAKAGQAVDERNVTWQDMVNACVKNGIPEVQHETIISQVYMAVFSGTKTQKLAAIRGLMDGYGVIVKPDNQQ
jgi:hypothetical protein